MFDSVYWAQNDLTCRIPANDINCIVIVWLLNGPLECHYIYFGQFPYNIDDIMTWYPIRDTHH